jgi:hypothetical protein
VGLQYARADSFRPLQLANTGTAERCFVIGAHLQYSNLQVARIILPGLAHAEAFILPGATHFLRMEKPRDMAAALSAFYRRYPLTV